jgi:hypothetical protein
MLRYLALWERLIFKGHGDDMEFGDGRQNYCLLERYNGRKKY